MENFLSNEDKAQEISESADYETPVHFAAWLAAMKMARYKDEQIKAERERVINLVVQWMDKNITLTHPRKEAEMPFVNITKFKDDINQILNEISNGN